MEAGWRCLRSPAVVAYELVMVYACTLAKGCGLLAFANVSHLLNEGDEEMGQTFQVDGHGSGQ